MTNPSRSRRRTAVGGWLFGGLLFLAVTTAVSVFVLVVEVPRRERNRAVELVRTTFGGHVETVSSCPEWLQGTFAEDYFVHVVSVTANHLDPLDPADALYLAAFRELDRLELTFGTPSAAEVVSSLPFSPDLAVLRITGPARLPAPGRVPRLEELALYRPEWAADDSERIARYTSLRRVGLHGLRADACRRAIPSVVKLPNLEELRLESSRVPDDALAHLVEARRLVLLDLTQVGVSPEGIAHLSKVPTLQHLELENRFGRPTWRGRRPALPPGPRSSTAPDANRVDDSALASLEGLKDLRFLQLDVTDVGDDGMRSLAKLPILQFLYLRNTYVGNEGVRHLASLRHLRRLSLGKSWDPVALIDDDAVDDLRRMKRLEALDVSQTDISREGLAMLRLDLPTARIQPSVARSSPSKLKQAKTAAQKGVESLP